MKILELFSGTRSIGKAFEARGHEVFSVDWNGSFDGTDWVTDVYDVSYRDVLERFGTPDVVWASPDCSTYSVAAISHHRAKSGWGNLDPMTDNARKCDRVNMHFHNLIMMLTPPLWFIENPRRAMRKMDFMHGLERYTVTYCQYGEERMKPTDIWTNHPAPNFKPPCRNGDVCHVQAPRGSKTGTQGVKGSIDRGRIPSQLCEHIVTICEDYFNERP